MNFNPTTPEINTNDSTTAPCLGASASPDDLAPGNDNHTRGGVADTTRLVAHPDVVRYIRATLRRYGVSSAQLMEDAIADVQADSIEAARMGRMPDDLSQWKALVATIATRWALDRRRKAIARAKVEASHGDDPDIYERPTLYWEHRDPVDTKRYLAVLDELFESGQMPDCGVDILCDEADRVPHGEVAAELGVSQTTIDNRLSRMRRRFRARLKALGLLAILLLMVVLEMPAGVVSRPAPEFRAGGPAPSACCMPGSDAGAPRLRISTHPSEKIAPFAIKEIRGTRERRFPLQSSALPRDTGALSPKGDAPPTGRDASTIGRDALTIGRDALTIDREALTIGRDALTIGRDALTIGRDAPTIGRDAPTIDRDALTIERDALTIERDALTIGRDALTIERDALTIERDALTIERDALTIERDALTIERDALTIERDALTIERDALTIERDALTIERDALTIERGALTIERNSRHVTSATFLQLS